MSSRCATGQQIFVRGRLGWRRRDGVHGRPAYAMPSLAAAALLDLCTLRTIRLPSLRGACLTAMLFGAGLATADEPQTLVFDKDSPHAVTPKLLPLAGKVGRDRPFPKVTLSPTLKATVAVCAAGSGGGS